MSDNSKNKLSSQEFDEIVKQMHREPIPELEAIWKQLGPFTNLVKKYSVDLLDEDPFFENVGKPYEVNWDVDFEVEQVASWAEAVQVRRLDEIIEVENLALERIDSLLDKYNRKSERNAISDLMIHYLWHHLTKRFPDKLAWYVPSDFKLALLEVILYDVGKPTFFRERWAWYDAGHFPCGTKNDGTRVIF